MIAWNKVVSVSILLRPLQPGLIFIPTNHMQRPWFAKLALTLADPRLYKNTSEQASEVFLRGFCHKFLQ